MNKEFLIFAITFCYFIGTVSCIESGCYTLEIDSLELLTGKIRDTRYFSLEPDSPKKNNELGFTIYAAESHKVCQNKEGLTFPFISPAMADEPISEYTSFIDLITITSNNSITTNDKLFLPGSNLNEIFEASLYDNFAPLNEFLSSLTRMDQSDQVNFKFSQTPDHPLNQQFFFKVVMSDGTIFKLESGTIQTN